MRSSARGSRNASSGPADQAGGTPCRPLVLLILSLLGAVAWGAGELEVVTWAGAVRVDGELLEPGQAYVIGEGATVETGADGNLFARYADGSQVRLKEDSIAEVMVIDPTTDGALRLLHLKAGTVEYLADPQATVAMQVITSRGLARTLDADFSVRIDAHEGDMELACVIIHNIDHTTEVEGSPDSVMSILKEEVEVHSRTSATMQPGSVLVLCPELRRSLDAPARRAIEIATDAVPVIRIFEASPFGETLLFDF